MAGTEAKWVATEIEKVLSNGDLPILYDADDMFFSSLEKRGDVVIVSNRDMRIPLQIRPGGKSRAYNPDGGNLGRGNSPETEKAIINTAHSSHALEITHKADIATDDKRKAVVSAFRKTLASGMSEFRRLQEALAMTAGNAVLATITSVANSGGKDTYTCITDGFGVKLLTPNQDVNVYSTDLLTQRTSGGEVTVELIDLDACTVRVSGTVPGPAVPGDKIVLGGVSGPSPVHILGVPYHNNNASTGSWLGFNRASYPEIRANRVDAAGDFALPFARLLVNKIGNRAGQNTGNRKLEAWMHPAQAAMYEEQAQLVMQINKTSKNEGIDLYFGDDMVMAGARVRTSFMWDMTRIDFIDVGSWGRAVMEDINFFGSKHGRKVFEVRGTDGGVAAAWLVYLVTSYNIFTDNPAAGGYISGLTIPAGYRP